MSNNPHTEDILGYTVVQDGEADCVDSIVDWISTGNSCKWLSCINPHSYAVARNDVSFSHALRAADWLVPDGAGIVLASKLLGGSIHARITGSDLFREVNQRLNKQSGSVFLLGATEDTLAQIKVRMASDFPRVRVAGWYSPPFKPAFTQADTDEMIKAVNAAAPDVLWVGLTSPKQDLWLHQNHEHLNVKFAAGIGAVFDFYTGRVKRSHPIFQKFGLEWLPRLLQEPRRLWRRTIVSGPIFVWNVLLQALKTKGKRDEKVRTSD
jgi:N-acetylglucosaminyldiphosphoundecaprenol N-acetyl-beta-D-mannosaminyltransferase